MRLLPVMDMKFMLDKTRIKLDARKSNTTQRSSSIFKSEKEKQKEKLGYMSLVVFLFDGRPLLALTSGGAISLNQRRTTSGT